GGMMGGNMNGMGGNASGQSPFADLMRQMQEMQQGSTHQDSNVIDGEAREVKPEAKKIEMKDVNK
ncbi:MAG: FxsA family protein, partial [Acinetobacter sp.]